MIYLVTFHSELEVEADSEDEAHQMAMRQIATDGTLTHIEVTAAPGQRPFLLVKS
jgi:hypothetical protein